MGAMSMESLPLGFRFRPTDEELINHYLRLKINGRHSVVQVIPEVDVCKWEPWDLPGLSVIKTGDPEWFFFCPRDCKYPNGHRSNRATDSGYWKATGKDRTIKSKKTLIGMKKTLVFYRGRAPKGERTNWIMHEYRPTQKELDGSSPGQSPFVLCRLFHKPEDRVNGVKSDETEQIGSTPSTSKSSPEDTSSYLVQETVISDTAVEKPSNDTQRWFSAKCGVASADGMLTNGRCDDGHMNSENTEDYMARGSPVEAFALHGQSPRLSWLTSDPIDQTTSLHVDSSRACDFGNDIIGSQFQNGTSELDLSLTELLDEVFNNPDDSSCEESASQKTAAAISGILSCGDVLSLQSAAPEDSFLNDIGSYSDSDAEMVQLRYDPGFGASGWYPESRESLQMQRSIYDQVVKDDSLSAYPATQSYYNNFIHPELTSNQLDAKSNFTNGIGIKIRARQHHDEPSTGFVNQGTAPRRIRLQMQSNSIPPSEKKSSKVKEGEKTNEFHKVVSEANILAAEPDTKYSAVGGHVGVSQIKIRSRRYQDRVKCDNVRGLEASDENAEQTWCGPGETEAEAKLEKLQIRQKRRERGVCTMVAVFTTAATVVGVMGWWISVGS